MRYQCYENVKKQLMLQFGVGSHLTVAKVMSHGLSLTNKTHWNRLFLYPTDIKVFITFFFLLFFCVFILT